MSGRWWEFEGLVARSTLVVHASEHGYVDVDVVVDLDVALVSGRSRSGRRIGRCDP